MLRTFGFGLVIGLIATLQTSGVFAAAPAGSTFGLELHGLSPVIQVQLSERQKCKALNRCRQKYTHCFNKLEKKHRLDDKEEVCVKPYQKCINASFGGFDWFFTRWFDRSYLDCSKY